MGVNGCPKTFFAALVVGVLATSPVGADIFVVTTSTTAQNDGNTINGADTFTVTSTGSIDTSGVAGTDAVSASGAANTIVNNGSLSAAGAASAIINTGTDGVITNNGSIRVSGTDGIGISATGFNPTSVNRGSILTTDENSHGYFQSGIGSFNNNGSISVTGLNADAMLIATATTTVTNSGFLSSTQGAAIRFTGPENTLNLNAPGFIVGQIVRGGTPYATFTTGASQSNYWQFSGPDWIATSVAGDVPYVLTNAHFATVDPSHFVAIDGYLGQLTNGAIDAVGQQLVPPVTSSTKFSPGGLALSAKNPSAPDPWVRPFGGAKDISGTGSILDHAFMSGGAMAGRT